ncbi:MAG: hypothetical protein QOJ39_3963 [Candidatus Eremiobacteraeota bacterium]|nr:hypothetical protein [Candidatus Eremiobacteraeota bacterium]
MIRGLNRLVVVLCMTAAVEVAIGAVAASRARHAPKTLSDRVHDYIEEQYHDCIPLGWYPERLATGTYYPAVNLDIVNNLTAFQALWVAIVPHTRMADSRVLAVKSVMDQLVTAGVLFRSDDSRGDRYNVTRFGQQFFYTDAAATGNAEGWPFVCYTRLRVTRLALGPPRAARRGRGAPIIRDVRIWWSTQTVADWPTPRLREQALKLQPQTNPAETSVYAYVDGEWGIMPFRATRADGATP